jgi:hypothetical protein
MITDHEPSTLRLPDPASYRVAPGGREQPDTKRPCPDCAGTGQVAVHDCRTDAECQRRCPRQEQCMACLATGIEGGRDGQ